MWPVASKWGLELKWAWIGVFSGIHWSHSFHRSGLKPGENRDRAQCGSGFIPGCTGCHHLGRSKLESRELDPEPSESQDFSWVPLCPPLWWRAGLELERLELDSVFGWGCSSSAAFVRWVTVGSWALYGISVVLGGLNKLARAPGDFQSAVSVLGLGASKFMCLSLNSGIMVFYRPPVLLVVNLTGFQNQLSRLVFSVLNSRAGLPNMGLKTLTPCDIPFLFRFACWCIVPDYITFLPLLLILMCIFLYLSCRRVVLTVFRSFSERVVLHVVRVLVCFGEELS